MSLREKYDFTMLANEAEQIVLAELELQLKREENQSMCQCQDCILDIAALALNQLKPAYHSSFKGVIYAQGLYNGGYKSEVERIVNESLEKVKKNPSHSE